METDQDDEDDRKSLILIPGAGSTSSTDTQGRPLEIVSITANPLFEAISLPHPVPAIPFSAVGLGLLPGTSSRAPVFDHFWESSALLALTLPLRLSLLIQTAISRLDARRSKSPIRRWLWTRNSFHVGAISKASLSPNHVFFPVHSSAYCMCSWLCFTIVFLHFPPDVSGQVALNVNRVENFRAGLLVIYLDWFLIFCRCLVLALRWNINVLSFYKEIFIYVVSKPTDSANQLRCLCAAWFLKTM